MSDRLRRQINVEREQINRMIDENRSLLEKSASERPSNIELYALAYILNSFYLGVENMLKRVAVEFDGGVPRGEAWHQQLLNGMATATGARPAVMTQDLYDALSEYLGFRHVFRSSYSFHLRWEKMSHLVLGCEESMRKLETEIETFLDSTTKS